MKIRIKDLEYVIDGLKETLAESDRLLQKETKEKERYIREMHIMRSLQVHVASKLDGPTGVNNDTFGLETPPLEQHFDSAEPRRRNTELYLKSIHVAKDGKPPTPEKVTETKSRDREPSEDDENIAKAFNRAKSATPQRSRLKKDSDTDAEANDDDSGNLKHVRITSKQNLLAPSSDEANGATSDSAKAPSTPKSVKKSVKSATPKPTTQNDDADASDNHSAPLTKSASAAVSGSSAKKPGSATISTSSSKKPGSAAVLDSSTEAPDDVLNADSDSFSKKPQLKSRTRDSSAKKPAQTTTDNNPDDDSNAIPPPTTPKFKRAAQNPRMDPTDDNDDQNTSTTGDDYQPPSRKPISAAKVPPKFSSRPTTSTDDDEDSSNAPPATDSSFSASKNTAAKPWKTQAKVNASRAPQPSHADDIPAATDNSDEALDAVPDNLPKRRNPPDDTGKPKPRRSRQPSEEDSMRAAKIQLEYDAYVSKKGILISTYPNYSLSCH